MRRSGCNKVDTRERLCRTFCRYYKPEKKEELVCRGFLVVDKLLREGRKISFLAFKDEISPSVQETLELNLCIPCAFHADDCDFARHKESPPCGGFLLLGHLLEIKAVSVDNLKDVR